MTETAESILRDHLPSREARGPGRPPEVGEIPPREARRLHGALDEFVAEIDLLRAEVQELEKEIDACAVRIEEESARVEKMATAIAEARESLGLFEIVRKAGSDDEAAGLAAAALISLSRGTEQPRNAQDSRHEKGEV
jgi:chromosome segregation ATPase